MSRMGNYEMPRMWECLEWWNVYNGEMSRIWELEMPKKWVNYLMPRMWKLWNF